MNLSGWGLSTFFKTFNKRIDKFDDFESITQLKGVVARGLGRSYGDSSIGENSTVQMNNFDEIISFDPENGTFEAEAGISLDKIIEFCLPFGWFPKVVPGTKFVTLGGMIASNVHGKNQHLDLCFGTSLNWLELYQADGSVLRCSKNENVKQFKYTIGGMGLTGIILRASFQLERIETGWINTSSIKANSLAEIIDLFHKFEDSKYTVAWLDSTARGSAKGRGIFFTGEHIKANSLSKKKRAKLFPKKRYPWLKLSRPCPDFLLNHLLLRGFNQIKYHSLGNKIKSNQVSWDEFFFPLDTITNWNFLYGHKGFFQYQAVFPIEVASEAIDKILSSSKGLGVMPFLAVVKRMKPDKSAYLTFGENGLSVALDFKHTNKSEALFSELFSITKRYSGIIYMTKDSMLTGDQLRSIDPRWDQFSEWRCKMNLNKKFNSKQSKRLGI